MAERFRRPGQGGVFTRASEALPCPSPVFLPSLPKASPLKTPLRPADGHGDVQRIRGLPLRPFRRRDPAAAPASAAALLPNAILCIRFLVIPYGGWVPYLTSTPVLTLGAPVLCALFDRDFGLIPSMFWGLMCGLGFSFPFVVLSVLPKYAAGKTSPSADGPTALFEGPTADTGGAVPSAALPKCFSLGNAPSPTRMRVFLIPLPFRQGDLCAPRDKVRGPSGAKAARSLSWPFPFDQSLQATRASSGGAASSSSYPTAACSRA